MLPIFLSIEHVDKGTPPCKVELFAAYSSDFTCSQVFHLNASAKRGRKHAFVSKGLSPAGCVDKMTVYFLFDNIRSILRLLISWLLC